MILKYNCNEHTWHIFPWGNYSLSTKLIDNNSLWNKFPFGFNNSFNLILRDVFLPIICQVYIYTYIECNKMYLTYFNQRFLYLFGVKYVNGAFADSDIFKNHFLNMYQYSIPKQCVARIRAGLDSISTE